MKKKIGILAFILAAVMCLLTISTIAGSNKENSKIPFIESEEIAPQHPEIQTEDEMMEEFEKMFGEKGKVILALTVFGVLFSLLFLPSLITVIIFGVLNSKTKKKIREYERFFGPIPQNSSAYYNPDFNSNPYYREQPVNPMNTPMGTPPSGTSSVPENDLNKWQGGQF